MELEGLKRALEDMDRSGVAIREVITDPPLAGAEIF